MARQVVDSVDTDDIVAWLRRAREPVDLLLALDLIEHLPRSVTPTFVELCARRLRPGGRLVVRTVNAVTPFFGQVRYDDLTHEQSLTPVSLSTLLSDAGLDDVEVRESCPCPGGTASVRRSATVAGDSSGWDSRR